MDGVVDRVVPETKGRGGGGDQLCPHRYRH